MGRKWREGGGGTNEHRRQFLFLFLFLFFCYFLVKERFSDCFWQGEREKKKPIDEGREQGIEGMG